MSEMVERVADAIEHALFGNPACDLMEVAKAAIEAMREPSDGIMISGVSQLGGIDGGYDINDRIECLRDSWRAMIDAALGK